MKTHLYPTHAKRPDAPLSQCIADARLPQPLRHRERLFFCRRAAGDRSERGRHQKSGKQEIAKSPAPPLLGARLRPGREPTNRRFEMHRIAAGQSWLNAHGRSSIWPNQTPRTCRRRGSVAERRLMVQSGSHASSPTWGFDVALHGIRQPLSTPAMRR